MSTSAKYFTLKKNCDLSRKAILFQIQKKACEIFHQRTISLEVEINPLGRQSSKIVNQVKKQQKLYQMTSFLFAFPSSIHFGAILSIISPSLSICKSHHIRMTCAVP